jgi:putative ABC transport system permease protein
VAKLKQEYPSPLQPGEVVLMPMASHLTGSVKAPLLILFVSVGLLLLIVCVNVANLLLVRVTAHSRELAIRTALGAGRQRLFLDLIAESLLLAAAGGVLGILLASWSLERHSNEILIGCTKLCTRTRSSPTTRKRIKTTIAFWTFLFVRTRVDRLN